MSSWAKKWVAEWLEGLGRITLLASESVASLFTCRVAWRDLLYQVYFIGREVPVGRAHHRRLHRHGAGRADLLPVPKVKMDTATLAVVSVSMCSELGPVLTGLMVAGRVGAAIAAELGTMRVTEQIDALRTLATHPVDYLVVPRLLALHIALPLLTAEAIAIGIGAGYLVGVYCSASTRLIPGTTCSGTPTAGGCGGRPDQGGDLRRHRGHGRLLQRHVLAARAPRAWGAPPPRRWCIPRSPS